MIVTAGLGATALRRNEELMVATSEAGDAAGDATALAAARPGSYVTPALIVITIFFMAAKAVCDTAAGGRRESSDCATNHTGLGSHPWPDASREPPS